MYVKKVCSIKYYLNPFCRAERLDEKQLLILLPPCMRHFMHIGQTTSEADTRHLRCFVLEHSVFKTLETPRMMINTYLQNFRPRIRIRFSWLN